MTPNSRSAREWTFAANKQRMAFQTLPAFIYTFDETLSFKHVCGSSFFHLINISRIRKYLIRNSVEELIHAFVTSNLDCCISLLCGLSKSLLQKLQNSENSVAQSNCYPYTEICSLHTCLHSTTLASHSLPNGFQDPPSGL